MKSKSIIFKVVVLGLILNNCNCDHGDSEYDVDGNINYPKVIEVKQEDIISVQDMDKYELLCKQWSIETNSSKKASIVEEMTKIGIDVSDKLTEALKNNPSIQFACDRNREIFNKIILPFHNLQLKMANLHPDKLKISMYANEDDLNAKRNCKELSKQEHIKSLHDELESFKKSLFI